VGYLARPREEFQSRDMLARFRDGWLGREMHGWQLTPIYTGAKGY
jgi:hypothetical protein